MKNLNQKSAHKNGGPRFFTGMMMMIQVALLLTFILALFLGPFFLDEGAKESKPLLISQEWKRGVLIDVEHVEVKTRNLGFFCVDYY